LKTKDAGHRLDREMLQDHAARLAAGLQAREAELCQAIMVRVRHLAPDADRDHDPTRVDAMRATIQAAVGSWLKRVARGEAGVVGLPSGSWENVRLAARHGTTLSATLQSYVTGHLVSWEFIVEEVESMDLEETERVALLKRISLLETSYFNELIALVSEAYLRERERLTRTHEQRVAQAIGEVLAGGDGSELDPGYALSGHHVGLVVSGGAPDEVVRRVACELDRQWLYVSRSERTLWVWLGGEQPLDLARLSRALGDAGEEAIAAAGEPAHGVDGFRLTHHQAVAAYAVAQRSGQPWTRYADVALVAWALRDEQLGAAFVDLYLGPLGAVDRRQAALRETLRAYFASGQNGASAAAALGVHERTVTHRLRAVEELMGSPVYARRAELETALRVEELLRPIAG
jgi:hypothetical protein